MYVPRPGKAFLPYGCWLSFPFRQSALHARFVCDESLFAWHLAPCLQAGILCSAPKRTTKSPTSLHAKLPPRQGDPDAPRPFRCMPCRPSFPRLFRSRPTQQIRQTHGHGQTLSRHGHRRRNFRLGHRPQSRAHRQRQTSQLPRSQILQPEKTRIPREQVRQSQRHPHQRRRSRNRRTPGSQTLLHQGNKRKTRQGQSRQELIKFPPGNLTTHRLKPMLFGGGVRLGGGGGFPFVEEGEDVFGGHGAG
jgi:hypothetical protein